MNIVFKPSAFEHEISESNIRYAFTHPYYDGSIEKDGNTENCYIRIGFVIYQVIYWKSCIMNMIIFVFYFML